MTTPTPDPTPDLGPEAVERLHQRLAAPPPPAGVLDSARAAAMVAFDEDQGTAVSPTAVVQDIGSAQPVGRAPAWYQRVPLGAAAAVIAVVALVGVATQIDLGTDEADTASSDQDVAASLEDSGDGRSAEATDDSQAEDSSSATGGDSELDSGSAQSDSNQRVLSAYEDIDALVEDFGDRYLFDGSAGVVVSPTTAASPTPDAAFSCDAAAVAAVDPSTVLRTEFVTIGGGAERSVAIALVYESETAGSRVAVVDDASCVLLADRAL